ncbi:MAG: protein kinase [Myxococcota bacterium]
MTGLPDQIRQHAPSLAEGRYRVVQAIDEDVVVRTYRAYDERLGLFRAVQVLAPRYANHPKIRELFVKQASRLVAFNHRHVVRVVDVQPEGALPWAVVEDHYGPSLLEHLAQHGPLTPRQSIAVMRQALDGLQALHEVRLAHSDVHPERLHVAEDGAITLSEPSLRWVAGGSALRLDEIGYVAPEQRRDPGRRTVASDLYGVGATLFALLTAKTPPDFLFEAESDDKVFDGLPKALTEVIRRCCAQDPKTRPRHARQVAEALLRAGRSVGSDPAGSRPLKGPAHELALPVAPDFPELEAILDRRSPAALAAAAVAREPSNNHVTDTMDVVWQRAQHMQDAAEEDEEDAATQAGEAPEALAELGRPETSAPEPDVAGLPYVMPTNEIHERKGWEPPETFNPETLPDYADEGEAERLAELERSAESVVVTPQGSPELLGAPSQLVEPSMAATLPAGADASVSGVDADAILHDEERRHSSDLTLRRPKTRGALGRWLLLGGLAGMSFAALALLGMATLVATSSMQLGSAARRANDSRAQFYQTIRDHDVLIGSMGQELYASHRRWVSMREEPARMRESERFLNDYLATMRAIPSTDPRSDKIADAARRFKSARGNYERALAEWRTRAQTFLGQTAIRLGVGARPPAPPP